MVRRPLLGVHYPTLRVRSLSVVGVERFPRIVDRDDGLEPTVGVLALDDLLITFYHYFGEFHTVPLPGPLCISMEKYNLSRERARCTE